MNTPDLFKKKGAVFTYQNMLSVSQNEVYAEIFNDDLLNILATRCIYFPQTIVTNL